MANAFDQFDASQQKSNPFDQFDASKENQISLMDRGIDVLKSAGVGLAKGAIGIAGLPGAARDIADFTFGQTFGRVGNAIKSGGSDWSARSVSDLQSAMPKGILADNLNAQNIQKQTERVTGEFYKPKTLLGEYAQTAGEFAPAALFPASRAGKLANVLIPASTSETAGQLTKGTAAEPYARLGGALIGGVGLAAFESAITPKTLDILSRAVGKNITEADVVAARQLIAEAQTRNLPLTWDEALNHVSSGRINLYKARRGIESNPDGGNILQSAVNQRVQNLPGAANAEFNSISPITSTESQLAQNVQGAARSAVNTTGEGQVLADAVKSAGPRTTPNQAGEIIQNELFNQQQGRMNVRAGIGDEAFGKQANGQVDVRPIVRGIDQALQSAKLDIKGVLVQARKSFLTPKGELDFSVQGLQNSRVAINNLIDKASRSGADAEVRTLKGVINDIDTALQKTGVDAAGQFASASRPLDVFNPSRPLGAVVERNQYNNSFVNPADTVPGIIQKGGTNAARDLAELKNPTAQTAYENNLITSVLDSAGQQGIKLSADKIRAAIRQNEDALTHLPNVRTKLENVANAREALDQVMLTPLGKLAGQQPDLKNAITTLFERAPLENSTAEIASTMRALSNSNPETAAELLRVYTGSLFKESTRGAPEFGASRFARNLLGNGTQAENFKAAFTAVKGEDAWNGFQKFMNVLEASGKRPPTGSQTGDIAVFNEMAKSGSVVTNLTSSIPTAGIRLLKRIGDRVDQWQAGKNSEELARILTNPESTSIFKAIAKDNVTPSALVNLAARLTLMGEQAKNRSP